MVFALVEVLGWGGVGGGGGGGGKRGGRELCDPPITSASSIGNPL